MSYARYVRVWSRLFWSHLTDAYAVWLQVIAFNRRLPAAY